jgi:hypothetical protein
MTNDVANEDHEVDAIIERLKDRFPQTSPTAIATVVDSARESFEQAKVRDFVPLFIEREARARLEDATA